MKRKLIPKSGVLNLENFMFEAKGMKRASFFLDKGNLTTNRGKTVTQQCVCEVITFSRRSITRA